MSDKSYLLVNELVAACVAFGRQVEPDWQTRIEKAQRELREYIAELEAETLELRKTLGWAYDLDEYKSIENRVRATQVVSGKDSNNDIS
jgi:hypothetical protein